MLLLRTGTHKKACQNSKQGKPWSDCFFRSSLIWVCAVCLCLFGRKLVFDFFWIFTVYEIIQANFAKSNTDQYKSKIFWPPPPTPSAPLFSVYIVHIGLPLSWLGSITWIMSHDTPNMTRIMSRVSALILQSNIILQKWQDCTSTFYRYRTYLLMKTCFDLNPFKPNGISHCYQLDQSISILRVVGWYFTFLFKFQQNIL